MITTTIQEVATVSLRVGQVTLPSSTFTSCRNLFVLASTRGTP